MVRKRQRAAASWRGRTVVAEREVAIAIEFVRRGAGRAIQLTGLAGTTDAVGSAAQSPESADVTLTRIRTGSGLSVRVSRRSEP